ncbi:AAA family ATPase [Amycolatopsis sp. NPDC051903]|uniref:helix-turn-helix transcriptional regulator n=1 Tax=Amycolatopsis sp. NPDC051903 TaxID=3363936 RepID=UPI0037AE5222
MILFGRDAELAALTQLVAGVRTGTGGALVLRGEAGIGKTALLGEALRPAEVPVSVHSGLEAEQDLPHAALHALLGEHDADGLPPAQAAALGTALGRGGQGAPDRLHVGLAVLTLLGRLAPAVLVADNLQWFDRESAAALLFAARRLTTESLLMLFATRDGAGSGLPELALGRLGPSEATELLRARARRLLPHELVRIRGEAAGNPLALLAFADPGAGSARCVEREFAGRIAALPEPARTVVLLAAADGTGDLGAVLSAAARLGAGVTDLATAERADLLRATGDRLEFTHPLIRPAAYEAAPLALKHAAHQALADVLDPGTEPDRHAGHRAAVAIGPDDDVARALAESGTRALRRGVPEDAATAFERAAQLTRGRDARGERLVAAATAAAGAGWREHAAGLARRAADLVTEPVSRARLTLLEATLAEGDRAQDAAALLETAESIAPADAQLAGELLLSVVRSAWEARDPRTVEQAARVASHLPDNAHVAAVAHLVHGYFGADVAPPAAIEALRRAGGPAAPRDLAMIARWHLVLSDTPLAHVLAVEAERSAHASGRLDTLSGALGVLARVRWREGNRTAAEAAAGEGLRLARDTGPDSVVGDLAGVRGYLAAVSGDEPGVAAAVAEIPAGLHERTPMVTAVRGLLDLGLGRFDAAADRLAGLTAERDLPDGPRWLPDLVEAATRCGRHDEARSAAERFTRWADAVGQQWAHAVARRCAALTGAGPAIAFAEAETIHAADGAMPFERARTALLHGEWLRRAHQRAAARSHLRTAADLFDDLAATPWADRARDELRATGELPHDVPADGAALLTAQERRVVRLAAQGLSNRDIGAQLFLSPRTVGYHLYKAFPKLGVTTRAQLPRLESESD